MSKCKYNYSSLMGKTRKNTGAKKGKDKKSKDLEDLVAEKEEDLDLDLNDLDLSDSSDSSDSDSSESEDETDDETSISKELNTMINGGIDSIKEVDLMMPAIGLGLITIIGFALYNGAKM
jgi:hypothetical protein